MKHLIEFEIAPPEVRLQHYFQSQQDIIENGIQKLQQKKTIISCGHEEEEGISPDGSFRYILNLKKLNENTQKLMLKWKQ